MKETFVFAPGVNGAELLRSLSKYGRNTLGYRVVDATELARMALMKSGVAATEGFLPRKSEPALIDCFLRDIPYFTSASYADSESLAASLYSLRSLIPEDETTTLQENLPEGEFSEKNEALLSVYELYLDKLAQAERIDTVGIIRKAMSEAEILDADILTLKEYPLSPLEQALVDRLSGGKAWEVSLTELFRAEPKPLHGTVFSECYGSSNEVRDILSFIYRNNVPLDHCTIAVAETLSYAELFHDLSVEYDIPMSFGCGLPITVSNPARLLKLYHSWNTAGYRGIDALSALIMSEAFDRRQLQEALPESKQISRAGWKEIIAAAGSLRLSDNAGINRQKLAGYASALEKTEYRSEERKAHAIYVLSCLRTIAGEMEKGPAYLIHTYSKIRDGAAGRIDRSAVTVIAGMIEAYLQFSENNDIDEIIPAILNKTVASENSREGHLHVCGISGAMAVPREYLFVAGLSAANFPGSPTENYLLLDSDYRLFGAEPQVPTSAVRIHRKNQILNNLLRVAAALGLKVRLSYSSYDLASLKDENPSSVLHEVYEAVKAPGQAPDSFDKAFRHVSFFEDRISRHSAIGTAYIEGKSITSDALTSTTSPTDGTGVDVKWSPSAIDDFFNCPRHFFLTRILGIDEPEADDPFEVIHANEVGTLAHSLMEQLGKEHMQKDAFLKLSGEAFDRFLLSRPPVHPEDAEREKQRFLRMMQNAFETDPGQEIVFSEEKKTVTHPSGVTLRGIPDRVEKNRDGRYLIVDFKTGRRINHKEDDIATCLQVLIYAYMMEQSGYDIAGCEYRYIRNRKTVTCRFDDEMKAKLADRLTEFRTALLSGDYPCAESEDSCRYCTLRSICGKDKKAAEEEEDSDE